jgi:anthranilate synthase/aminodeoxychorismate synthase-like glutamine amidotransferase
MILLIDNYDSFTWNLVQRLAELDRTLEVGRDLLVVRNDEISPEAIERLDHGQTPSHIVISPGPCTPKEAGVSSEVVERFAGRVPILGVCLGHQCMAEVGGMTVARHEIQVHGKTSRVQHDGRGLFAGLSDPFEATRYHSLVVLPGTIPPRTPGRDGWEVSAWTLERSPEGGERKVVMGLRRVFADPAREPMEGVQFHPESFLTREGPRLLANFLRMGRRGREVREDAILAIVA